MRHAARPLSHKPNRRNADMPIDAETDQAMAVHAQLVAALRRPGACAGQVEAAELIETHISSLLLAGEFVFKLKKPVALPFVDFSRIELRHQACLDELRLNRRTAPHLYLAVVPVLGGGDALLGPVILAPTVAGTAPAGDIVNWAVMMRRFDDRLLFSHLARAGNLRAEQVDALAEVVARFHAGLPPAPAAFGHAEASRAMARQNMAELVALTAGTAAAADWQALQRWTESRGGELAALMDQRRRSGHVREVHGDLHLANIVWCGDAPLLFDALEFNASMRHIDTIADLAFTFMDLVAAGLPRLAWRFISAVLDASGDHAALPLLRWWAVHRAAVRAKVALLAAAGQGGAGVGARVGAQAGAKAGAQANAQESTGDEAQRYQAAANQLAGLAGAAVSAGLAWQGNAKPALRLVLACGLSGSGKSLVAGALAEHLGAVRLRSDVERKRLFGLPPTGGSAPGLYALEASVRTYERLQQLAAMALSGQISVVVDAASLQHREREALQAVALRHGAAYRLLVCEAPLAVLQQRVMARREAGKDASDATLEVLAQQQQWAEWPTGAEAEHRLSLDTDCSLDELTRRIEALPI